MKKNKKIDWLEIIIKITDKPDKDLHLEVGNQLFNF